MKPLRLRPLQANRARIYRPPFMKRMLAVDVANEYGEVTESHAWSLPEAFEVIAAKRAADRPKETIDYTAVATQRERRETTNV